MVHLIAQTVVSYHPEAHWQIYKSHATERGALDRQTRLLIGASAYWLMCACAHWRISTSAHVLIGASVQWLLCACAVAHSRCRAHLKVIGLEFDQLRLSLILPLPILSHIRIADGAREIINVSSANQSPPQPINVHFSQSAPVSSPIGTHR